MANKCLAKILNAYWPHLLLLGHEIFIKMSDDQIFHHSSSHIAKSRQQKLYFEIHCQEDTSSSHIWDILEYIKECVNKGMLFDGSCVVEEPRDVVDAKEDRVRGSD